MPSESTSIEENRGHRGGHNAEVAPPSPEEIAAACEELRKSWPERRLRLRAGFARYRVQRISEKLLSITSEPS
jgi:hypothetical protein